MKFRENRIYLSLILSFLFSLQSYARVVVSESTREPIIYASIGVLHHSLGTLSDTLGNFSLTIPAEYLNDTLRISSIGYLSKDFLIKDLKNLPDTIFLADDMISLKEVVVKPIKIKSKIAGRKGTGGFIYINVEGYKAAGQGLAIPLKVKNLAWVKKLGFSPYIYKQALSEMKFRINFYRKTGDKYIIEKDIKPIFFDYNKNDVKDDRFIVSFPEEVLLDEGEYYVELEFLSNFSDEFFYMKTKPLTGKTRYRYASQSEWETLPFAAPLYVEYDCVE